MLLQKKIRLNKKGISMNLRNFITHSFITLFLNITFTTINCMEPIEKTTHKKKSHMKRLTTRIGNVLLGKNKEKLLFPEFADLPKDLQDYILTLLTINSSAETLKEATTTINALARVNKELNNLINSPKFCLEIINHLSDKFSLPTVTVATALGTQGAQKYIAQNFFNPDSDKNGNTLLMSAVSQLNESLVKMIIKNKKVNLNTQNRDGNTALHLALYAVINAQDHQDLLRAQKIAKKLILHPRINFFIENNYNETPRSLSFLTYNAQIKKAMADAAIKKIGL